MSVESPRIKALFAVKKLYEVSYLALLIANTALLEPPRPQYALLVATTVKSPSIKAEFELLKL